MGDREKLVEYFIGRGLTSDEAERQYEYGNQIYQYVSSNKDEIFATSTMGLLISYGTV